MKIAIINSVAGISSKELAVFLRDPGVTVDVFKPFKVGRDDFQAYDLVFNYGYSKDVQYKNIINKPSSVAKCVDKPSTFKAFKKAGVDTVEHVTRREDIPKHWAWVTVRDKKDGRKAEGLAFYENIPGTIPDGALFSEYYEHKYEYRVVVFMGKVLGYYFKYRDGHDIWHFLVQPKKGFEEMGRQCIAAAKALDIDYVGFDVVANTKKDFRILEANSAPVLTTESMEAIHYHIFNQG